MIKLSYILSLIILCFSQRVYLNAQAVPLPAAHAHNDYNHERPLLDALTYGFTSIEVDVLLIDGELYVGHEMPESSIHNLNTLNELYLKPLDSIIGLNRGFLFPEYRELCYLMIDIKSNPYETYALLYEQLATYKSWIYSPKLNPAGKVVVFLSGNRPVDEVINDPDQLLSLDGRPDDLGKGYTKTQMPVVSQAFYLYSQWRGVGEMNTEDKAGIKSLAEAVHLEDKKLRLWAHPDNIHAWELLQDLGVDIINSDDLVGVYQYFLDK